MIDFYSWTTPNGYKVSTMLEETGLDYTLHTINIGADEQFSADFLKLSPNNKIPAIIDSDTGVSVFESGAILIYLAEKTGMFLPKEPAARAETLQWLMWQMGGVGPMIGQLGHFSRGETPNPHATQRFLDETIRLFGVMDKRLQDRTFIAGEYSIADMALYPWVSISLAPVKGMKPEAVENMSAITKWLETMANRPAVAKGMTIGG